MARIGLAFLVLVLACTSTGRGEQESQAGGVSEASLAKCDPYLAELFRQPDEAELVDELCTRINFAYDTNDLKTLRELPPAQKVLWDVWSSKALIDNGGMLYFLTADYVDYAGRAESFRELGLPDCADLLEQAYAEFPESQVPDNVEEREKLIEQMPDEVADRWEEITNRYFDRDGRLTLLLGEHARKNAAAFVALEGEADDEKLAELRSKAVPLPAKDATGAEVVAWLKATGGGSFDRGTDVLNHVYLGDDRRTTSEELRALAEWKGADGIEQLALDDTSFSDDDAPLLLKFKNLRALHLRDVDISAATIDVVEQIPKLRELWITGTRVPYERIRQLVTRKEFDDFMYQK